MARDPIPYDDFEWDAEKRVPATAQLVVGWDGEVYELTLADHNVAALTQIMENIVSHARSTGLKMPQLPRNLREEFPQVSAQQALEDITSGPPMLALSALNPVVNGKPRKPPTPSFATADERTPPPAKKADEKTRAEEPVAAPPEGDEKFWTTPTRAPWPVAQKFKTARDEIWKKSGHKPIQGRMPPEIEKVAYEWGRENPGRVQELRELRREQELIRG